LLVAQPEQDRSALFLLKKLFDDIPVIAAYFAGIFMQKWLLSAFLFSFLIPKKGKLFFMHFSMKRAFSGEAFSLKVCSISAMKSI
jgi:hypothetical protein